MATAEEATGVGSAKIVLAIGTPADIVRQVIGHEATMEIDGRTEDE